MTNCYTHTPTSNLQLTRTSFLFSFRYSIRELLFTAENHIQTFSIYERNDDSKLSPQMEACALDNAVVLRSTCISPMPAAQRVWSMWKLFNNTSDVHRWGNSATKSRRSHVTLASSSPDSCLRLSNIDCYQIYVWFMMERLEKHLELFQLQEKHPHPWCYPCTWGLNHFSWESTGDARPW